MRIGAGALRGAAAALLAAACTPSGGEAGRGDARPPTAEEKKMSEEAGSSGAAEPAGDDAAGQDFVGVLDIERIAGGKRLQATTLECDDGERYILSYRPMLDHLDKVERRVIVRAERFAPEPGAQAVGGRHLRVLSIRLADGEAPAPVVDGALPVPPIARSGAEARARVGRWVLLVGVLVGVEPGDDTWQVVTLRLADGVEVEITETRGIVDRVYRPHFGAQVTALGNLFAGEEGRLGLGRVALCAGEVDGCGMTTAAIRRF